MFLQDALRDGADLGRAIDDGRAGGGEGLHLGLCGAGGADDDRSGVAHPASRRGGGPGDEGDDRLGRVRADVLRGLLLGQAADLADETTAAVSGSSLNRRSASTGVVPTTGSPPTPTQVD